jgi:hypothetical protein
VAFFFAGVVDADFDNVLGLDLNDSSILQVEICTDEVEVVVVVELFED